MTKRNKKNPKRKFLFEFTSQVSEFFGEAIPESWEDAHYLMQVENKQCSKDLYLEALIEQQNKDK